MTTNVTNISQGGLSLPNGPLIPAGRTVPVENWSTYKTHPVVKSWLELGALSTDEDAAAQADKSVDDMTKAELVEHAKARGIQIDASKPKDDVLAAIKAAENSAA